MAGGILQSFFQAGGASPNALSWNGGMDPVGSGPMTGAMAALPPPTAALAPPPASDVAALFSPNLSGPPSAFMSFGGAMAPPASGSPAPSMGSAPPPQQGGGFLDRLHQAVTDNSNALTGTGMALLGGQGWGGAAQQWAVGSRADSHERDKRETREEKARKRQGAFNLATQMGFSKEQATSLADDPDTLNRLWLHRQTREPSEFERLTKGLDEDQVEQARLHRLGIAPEKPRFEKIGEDEDSGKVQYGWVYPQSGKVVPYSEARNPAAANQVLQQGGGQALPGASAPVDGVRPRPPGVDAKTWRQEEAKRLAKQGQPSELPAELAGRLALTDEYLKRAPEIGTFVKDGGLTGLWDANRGSAGYGKQGEVYRQIQSGVDGLRRSLTGAGMPADEAAEYANRYLPQVTDTAEKLYSKHQQLTAELQRFSDLARQGRGGTPPVAPSGAPDRAALEAEARRRGLIR